MANRNQVAKLAGVSVAAVSRVLNNSGYVSQDKRERVERAVRELDYRPNPIARSLKSNSSHQLLFYIRDISNSYYIEMYTGMATYSNSRGYMPVVSGGFNREQLKSLMIDGILLPSEDITAQEFTKGLRVPIVAATYGKVVQGGIKGVYVDVAHALRIAVAHLRSKGHREIGYISANTGDDLDPRQAAFIAEEGPVLRDRLRDVILGPPEWNGPLTEVRSQENGMKAGFQYLERRPEVTAFVCFNDDTAIGFISCIQEHGVHVPEDLSIVGIDGHWGGKYSSPPLTTVSISPREHGAECARLLIDLVEGREVESEPRPIAVRLIERGSVKARR
jgi:LacI family transcriptional regulator, repressor for deo operon, udp, cdd, tsx, nupC, and nupG